MIISIIVAVASDGAIGKNNDLPWHLGGDLKRFKETTMGHTILMGRHTYQSLPKGALPGRRNVVVSKRISIVPDADVFPTVEEAVRDIRKEGETELFVIGGAALFGTMLPYADRLYLTRVETEVADADTFFPEIDFNEWEAQGETAHYEADAHNDYPVSLTVYNRKKETQKKLD